MRIIIIGGVAGGMSAATRLRRLNENAEIIVIEKSGHVSYANCGLPYYVGGVIEEEKDLLLQTPASLHARFRLDVRVSTEVLAINPSKKMVALKNLVTGETAELDYDKLILSPGASPVVPPIPGNERGMTLRTVEDVEKIAASVGKNPGSAVVIGGGFIGVEIAENLVHRKIPTALVEATDQVLMPLDPELATLVAQEMRSHGVDLRLGASVVKINNDSVELSNGQVLPAEIVILAIGVRPEIGLAKAAGLEIGSRNGIKVNDFNRTINHDIYAVGDAAEKTDDLMIATTGWNEKRLKAADRPHQVIHIHPNSHAGYYPDAKQMTLKLIFDPKSGEILGAQGVGIEGVDKRIDVIATAMRGGITAPELADLELAYAPPFGSAKDPVNMLGYVAENVMSGVSKVAQWHEIDEYREKGFELLDVRSEAECGRGIIPGAINIPVDEIRDRQSELTNINILVNCQVGLRGHTGSMLLRELGFNAVNLDGGYLTWINSPAGIN